MWKAFLFLACVAVYIAIVSCDDETNPSGETEPKEETEPDGTSSYGSRRCVCYPPICPKNEVYYNCSGGCIPRRCSEIGFPLICDKHCSPGCICKDGYVRADNGTCIPILECPSCGGDKNAQQGCSNYCGHTCSTYNKPPRPCPLFCIFNGCDCRKGYVYDNNIKACVKPKDCTPICKVNEEYSSCVNGGCDARNCSQIGKPVPCVKIDPKYCIKGCICVKGYLRASNGTCVPKDQCKPHPPICPKNEVYYNCSGGCIPRRRCSELGFPLKCDKKCTSGCVCKDGYVRADNGTCIPILKCPSCGGDKNAQQGCGINCGRTCSTYKNPPKECPPGCIFNGCDCRKGYVYDNIKKACVKPEDCTPICKVNEQYSSCANGGCEARNCSQIGKPIPCIHPKYCIKGCICVKGYLRASNGICVPKDQCKPHPPICPKNEVYYNCSGGCIPRRCSELGFPLKCNKKCTPGCVCKAGYVRADNGTCIPIPKCPSCGGDKNAQQGCGINCGRTCSTYKNPPKDCPPGCIFNGCDCRKGYVYDNIKKACVKPEDCTPICKVNEQYSSCANGGCEARNCSQIGKPIPCIHPKYCIKGCICVKGYLRASNGICVPKDQCKPHPPICPKNEVYYNCSGGCIPRRCSELGFPLKCNKKCTPGCVCKAGYVRADNGTCIPIPKCPSCGGDKNAQQGCGINCGRTCSTYKNPPKDCPPGCIFNGCDCRKGYVYDNIKKACVKPEDCTPICKINEQYSSCANGGCEARNCSQIGKPIPCIHPKYCIKGCICVKGYLRASNGICVPKDQCKPHPPICPKNEVYYNCSGGCIPRRCSELGFPLKCNKKCTPGCVCKAGYVRADNGTCIPIPKCPSCGGDKNAQQGCGINCGHTCSTYKNPPKDCPPGCIFNGCDCRKGYVYDNIKKACVKPEDCTPICKVNEQYSSCANGGCEARNCSQIGKPIPCIHPKYCIKGCICVKGYLRASNGICVPKDQCKPHPPICPKNEVYYNCSGGCIPRRCSELGFPLKCDKKCTPGCVCKAGYVRADNGTCIPIPKCPSCGGDKNAQQGCGINCGRTCSTYKNPPKECPPGCIFNGCDCRKGYVYDNIIKACVKPEDCTPICKVNEQYSSCANGGCEARNCSQIGKPIPCIHPKYCIKGCICVKGYLRASNGICVPKDQCKPHPPICPKTEVYYNCSGGCIPRRCSELGFPLKCDKKCSPGCVCKAGYVRSDNGTCIPIPKCPSCGGDKNAQQGCGINCGRTCSTYKNPPKQCPLGCIFNGCDCRKGYVYDNIKKACVKPEDCTPICGLNEVYSSCTNGGCGHRNCSQLGQPELCIDILPEYCTKGCVCADGYLRAINGTCVPKHKCPDTGCGGDPNAQPGCGYNCGKTCSSYKIKHPICPRVACRLNGCDCKDGYVYDSNVKKCVLPKKCTPICKVNEEYNSCVNCVCEPRNCSQIGKPVPCIHPKYCIQGCICIKGYLRASNGTCVPKDQCTPKCDKPNEVYDVCPAPCPPKRCDVNEALIKCGTPPKPGDPDCKPGCRCADKYYRNATGTCVLKKNCEKPLICDRPNEVYDGCGIFCPPQECGIDPAVVLCLRPPEYGDPACKPRCVCIDGYVRNDARECVARDKCPQNCPIHEEYSTCINGGCDARNCSQVGKPVPCVKIDPKWCIKGCVCVNGYLRAANGTCVPKERCPPKCDKPNQVYDVCPAPCPPKRCDVRDALFKCKAPPKPGDKDCKPGCRCADKYYLNATGSCVLKKNCEKPLPCDKPNEVYDPCPAICPTQTCGVKLALIRCMRPPEYGDPACKPSCVCIKGYVRNNAKQCIPRDECPQNCPVNEEYSTCINGGCVARNCSQVGKPVPCVKIDPKWCIKGCVCVNGYLRAANGTCVPKDRCPPKCDKPNQVYDVCPAPCPPKRCNVKAELLDCAAPPKPGDKDCKPGCRCADKYYLNATGSCVLKNNCEKPLPCDQPNEVYNACPPICPPQKCGINPALIFCPRSPEYGDPACKPRCVCIDGYVRNDDNKCIPRDKCPKCTGQNEYWEPCIRGCSNQTCGSINQTYHCPLQKGCKSGCRCNPGFYRNDYNVCVPEKECPKTCGKNEHWEECYYSCGGNQTCDDIGKKYNCPAKQKCCSGCRCDKGYWRNAYNVCIPEKQCGCGGDPNAQPGCGYNCGKTCTTYKLKHPICPRIVCKRNGCDCKDGYVYDSNVKKCVLPKKCTPICQVNEEYSSCVNGGCDARNCSQIGKPVPCIKIDPKYCIKGCICIKGYLRASNGTCVPKDQCTPRCYGKNEVWVNCYQGCSNQSCDDIGKIFHCPNQPAGQCKSGCRCKPGTWRNAYNVCVPQEECPKPECRCGEEWNWCPTIKCDGDYCPKTKDSPQTCPVGIICDKPRCVCKNNRKRDWKTGKCIRIQKCPKFKCGYNEEYQACQPPCPGETCSDYINGPGRCPLIKYICRPQCRCIKDYYRNANGICIPACDCPGDTSITTTEPPTTTSTRNSGGGTGLTGILDGITAFTGISLYNRMKSKPTENIILSAMSVLTPIAQLCLWSKGSAYDQCIKVLNLKDKQDIRDTFPKLDASYGDQTSVNFSVAVKMYSHEKYKLSDGFKKDAVDVFNASAEELDFSKNKVAADIINAWVESKTNNRIQDLVTPDMFSSLTRLVLVNAIYFKGTWLYEFNKNNTKEDDFYLNDGTTKKTQMMGQEIKDLDYGEIPSLDCTAVRVYYKGKTSSMIIILPNTKNGTLDLAKNLQDPTNWKKVTDSLSPQKVQLYLPLFKITTTTDLKDLLKKANITDWFNCENSGLEGLLAKPEPMCITEAIQKAFVEVNEQGAEAAAANAVVVTKRSLPFPPPVIKVFKTNRAFLYYLEVGSVVPLCGAFNG